MCIINEPPRSPEGFRDEISKMSFRLVRNLSLLYYIFVYNECSGRIPDKRE